MPKRSAVEDAPGALPLKKLHLDDGMDIHSNWLYVMGQKLELTSNRP